MASDIKTGGVLRRVEDIRYYTGGDKCQYKCGDMAEFVVVGDAGSRKVTFGACLDCLNREGIYPIENEWVDERDHAEKRRNA